MCVVFCFHDFFFLHLFRFPFLSYSLPYLLHSLRVSLFYGSPLLLALLFYSLLILTQSSLISYSCSLLLLTRSSLRTIFSILRLNLSSGCTDPHCFGPCFLFLFLRTIHSLVLDHISRPFTAIKEALNRRPLVILCNTLRNSIEALQITESSFLIGDRSGGLWVLCCHLIQGHKKDRRQISMYENISKFWHFLHQRSE